MPHAAGPLVWAAGGCCSGPLGWACWRVGGRGPGLEPRACWVAVPTSGTGLPRPVSRDRGAETAWLGRGLQLWPKSRPSPGGIGGWRVPTWKHHGQATHPKPGLLAARRRAWGPVPLGRPRRVSGVGVTGWSSIRATAGAPQPRPAEALLPPAGPGRQLRAHWPAASDRTAARLSRVLSRWAAAGRPRRPVWGHETAECVLGRPCLVRTGCWQGPSSQKSCSSGTALSS